MKVVGIIAEFNPFHNGHKLLIDRVKEMIGADFVIVIMSGNYVQRGEPAVIDKYQRAKCALLEGVDIVLELPVRYSSASARDFARGAVALLDSLGCITHLAFGAEEENINALIKASEMLSNMSEEQDKITGQLLRQGLNYPLALSRTFPDLKDILDKSNNLLAIEYLSALKYFNSSIIPVAVKREGDHNDTGLDRMGNICSSTAIRNSIFKSEYDELLRFLPENSHRILTECISKGTVTHIDAFSDFFSFRLFEFKKMFPEKGRFISELTTYQDMDKDLAAKIYNLSDFRFSISLLCEKLKAKNYTRARINRAILHFILSIKDTSFYKSNSYLRLLGLKKDAGFLLKGSQTYIISKPVDALSCLNENALCEYRNAISCDDLYYMMGTSVNQKMHKELSSNIIIF